jgi:hypothetical protein
MTPLRRAGLRAPRRLPWLLGAVLFASCFDPPVEEVVELSFAPEGAVEVRVEVTIASADEPSNPALAKRLDDLRQALLGGYDEWSRRFERVRPAEESLHWQKDDGVLYSFERRVVLAGGEGLTDLFADTGLSVFYTPSDEGSELAIYPGEAQLATRSQRRRMEQAIADWAERLAAYQGGIAELYRYMEANPASAAPCFAALLSDVADDEVVAAIGPPTEAGQALVDQVRDRFEEAWDVLLVPEGEAWSLDELSRLVYDAFPAKLVLRLPSSPREVEGFSTEEDHLSVRPIGLWSALESLEGRWLAPDPLLLYVRASQAESRVDLAEVTATRRRWTESLTPAEIGDAIVERLVPPESYRAVW